MGSISGGLRASRRIDPAANATPIPVHQRSEARVICCVTPTWLLYTLVSFGLFTVRTLVEMARLTHAFTAAETASCFESTSPQTCCAALRIRAYRTPAPARVLMSRSE